MQEKREFSAQCPFAGKKKTTLDIFQSSDLYMEKLRDKENFHNANKQAKGIR